MFSVDYTIIAISELKVAVFGAQNDCIGAQQRIVFGSNIPLSLIRWPSRDEKIMYSVHRRKKSRCCSAETGPGKMLIQVETRLVRNQVYREPGRQLYRRGSEVL